jgi:hypothetical protein
MNKFDFYNQIVRLLIFIKNKEIKIKCDNNIQDLFCEKFSIFFMFAFLPCIWI